MSNDGGYRSICGILFNDFVWKFGHVACFCWIHSFNLQMRTIRTSCKDLLQQAEADKYFMKLIMGDWRCMSIVTMSKQTAVLAVKFRIIPKGVKSVTQVAECEEHTHCFLWLAKYCTLWMSSLRWDGVLQHQMKQCKRNG